MSQQTNDFQRLIKRIYDQIVPTGGLVTESGMVWDRAGNLLREVDILVEYQYAGHGFKFIVECRDRSRKETIEWIDGLIGKASELSVNKVIAVSSTGFAKPAREKAAAVGIETITLEDAETIDWERYSCRPGIIWYSDESYRLHDVLVKPASAYRSLIDFGLDSPLYVGDNLAGTVESVMDHFFTKYLIPELEAYKTENLLKIFKEREDLEKTLHFEIEKAWPGAIVKGSEGDIELNPVKFVVFGKRSLFEGEQLHRKFKETVVSTSATMDGAGNLLESLMIQEPNSSQIKWSMTKKAKDA